MIAVGVVLAAIPFVAFVAMTARELGWREAVAVWGCSLLVAALIVGGFLLIEAGVKA